MFVFDYSLMYKSFEINATMVGFTFLKDLQTSISPPEHITLNRHISGILKYMWRVHL